MLFLAIYRYIGSKLNDCPNFDFVTPFVFRLTNLQNLKVATLIIKPDNLSSRITYQDISYQYRYLIKPDNLSRQIPYQAKNQQKSYISKPHLLALVIVFPIMDSEDDIEVLDLLVN